MCKKRKTQSNFERRFGKYYRNVRKCISAVMLGDAEPEGGQKSQTSSFGFSLVWFGFGGFETWSHHIAQAPLETIR